VRGAAFTLTPNRSPTLTLALALALALALTLAPALTLTQVVNATGGGGEEGARCAAEAKKASLINRLSGLFKKGGDNAGL